MTQSPKVAGFLKDAKKTAHGKTYSGRFTCQDVQWVGTSRDLLATFAITAQELADAAENGLIWTDQDVQRGIQPGVTPQPGRELCLRDGYPDSSRYIFDRENADDMVEKLLADEKLFLSPLIWNLRPGEFESFWDDKTNQLHVYSGKIFLPDSHHRQQAILKAVRTWRQAPGDYPKFSAERQFKVELYFLSREDEGNYFFDKNQRTKQTAKSKAFDLTTMDDLSVLAKKVIERSKNLEGNVNRVTDRLIAKNPQVVTLSTLREMMRTFAPTDSLDEKELDGMAYVAGTFYDLLSSVRPELGVLGASARRAVREKSLVDSAVMMHGYAALMRAFNEDLSKTGQSVALRGWRRKVEALSPSIQYKFEKWSGDLFDKRNPLWSAVGIVKPGKGLGALTVLNTGGARSEAGRVLRQLTALNAPARDLRFLANR